MLRIKYFENFKSGQPFLVVTGDRDSFLAARNFLEGRRGASLGDASIAEFVDTAPLPVNVLYLNENECRGIAEQFDSLATAEKPAHTYFDSDALPHTEILISYLEYDNLF